MAELLWMDGRLRAAEEARLSPLDRTLLYGEGLFETLRCYRGTPHLLAEHRRRLAAGARALGLATPPTTARLRRAIAELVRARGLRRGDAAIRVTLTAGADGESGPTGPASGPGSVILRARALARARGPRALRAGFLDARRLGRPAADLKSTSYLGSVLARRACAERGLDEGILVSGALALEGSTSNLFAWCDGTLVTPPADGRILAGVTRARVIAVARELGYPVAERELAVAEIARATEVFATSALLEIGALVEIEGAAVGRGRPGPRTRRLFRRYRGLALDETATQRA